VACRGSLVGLVKNLDKKTNGENYNAVAEAEAILAEAQPVLV